MWVKEKLLVTSNFKKAYFPGASKGVIVWERVKTKLARCLMSLRYKDWVQIFYYS